MITIDDYKDDPYRAVTDFEQRIADYTGARYAVATDSCTHAIELCLRLLNHTNVTIPKHTYLSIPMLMHKLNIKYTCKKDEWYDALEYNIGNTSIWDSARKLEPDMYRAEQMQCLSFGHSKPLEIGRGGMILLDDAKSYKWLKRAAYDGRNLCYSNWANQKTFQVGYHYMMRPEEAIDGLNILDGSCLNEQHGKFNYPDVSELIIK